MITVGSLSRDAAQEKFPFLSAKFKGRRRAIKEFTHLSPEFVFWIYPNGDIFDAKGAHKKNQPKGYSHILNDEPNYCGFLRGRVASNFGPQLIVVYCRATALSEDPEKIRQLVLGIEKMPIPINGAALVISDNADIYGTVEDIRERDSKKS